MGFFFLVCVCVVLCDFYGLRRKKGGGDCRGGGGYLCRRYLENIHLVHPFARDSDLFYGEYLLKILLQ